MKHATPSALEQLAPLLDEDPRGLFADVRLKGDFDRFAVNTDKQRASLVERIDRRLAK